ncbi:MAG: aldose epimerase family protein [Promethearchaeota archaeon]
METRHEKWGSAELLKIKDPNTHFEVHLTNFGASIVKVFIPDKDGNVGNVVFGHNSPHDYRNIGGYMGATVGRVANRIQNGQFSLDGDEYQLARNNNGQHCLHGGMEGFSYKLWNIIEVHNQEEPNQVRVTMEYISIDGEENFPGKLTTRVIFTLSPMKIQWEFFAFSDTLTIVNLTNHSYWNLDTPERTIDDHILTLYADNYNEIDELCLPTGIISDVDHTGIDFRFGKRLADTFASFGDVDNNFFITDFSRKTNPLDVIPIGELVCPRTGRSMYISTSEPCVQIYTGNFMDRVTSYGKACFKHNAICLETQRMPDAINYSKYRNQVILRPGLTYSHKTVHTFSVLP